jgi:hypothetical protein
MPSKPPNAPQTHPDAPDATEKLTREATTRQPKPVPPSDLLILQECVSTITAEIEWFYLPAGKSYDNDWFNNNVGSTLDYLTAGNFMTVTGSPIRLVLRWTQII